MDSIPCFWLNAIKELKGGGFDIKKLAVVGRDYQTEETQMNFA